MGKDDLLKAETDVISPTASFIVVNAALAVLSEILLCPRVDQAIKVPNEKIKDLSPGGLECQVLCVCECGTPAVRQCLAGGLVATSLMATAYFSWGVFIAPKVRLNLPHLSMYVPSSPFPVMVKDVTLDVMTFQKSVM